MPDINERLRDHAERRRHVPGSIAAMETREEADGINRELALLEDYAMRLAACWDGELDAIGAYSQLAYLHEKAEAVEEAAGAIREAVERLADWSSSDEADVDPDDED